MGSQLKLTRDGGLYLRTQPTSSGSKKPLIRGLKSQRRASGLTAAVYPLAWTLIP